MTGRKKALIALMIAASLMLTQCAQQWKSSQKIQRLEAYELQQVVELIQVEVDKIDPYLTRQDYFVLYQAAHNAYIDAEKNLEECELDRKNLVKEVDDFYYQDY